MSAYKNPNQILPPNLTVIGKDELAKLQAQRDELLSGLRTTASYCKTQADFNSDEVVLWSQCQQIADAAIARATEGGQS